MLRPSAITLAVLLACSCMLPAAALAAGQTAPATAPAAVEAPITLRVNSGSVMVSDGGDFATANTGMVLQPGDRLMVAEGGSATVVISDNCNVTYDTPGVHVVRRRCAAAIAGAGPSGKTIGLIAGGAALLAVALSSGGGGDGDSAPPPVSR